MEFKIYNERGHPSSEEFLEDFLDPVSRSLAAHLGRLPAGPVHVVLSNRPTHENRFPPHVEHLTGGVWPELRGHWEGVWIGMEPPTAAPNPEAEASIKALIASLFEGVD